MLNARLLKLLLAGGCLLALCSGALAHPMSQDKTAPPPKQEEKKPSIKVVRRVDPDYPQAAQDADVSGKVTVEVVVETSGEVSLARIVNGHRLLNQAAIDAARQWRFSNTYDGPVTIQLTFKFGDSDGLASEAEQKADVKPTRKVNAVYPDEAKRKGVQGEVVVAITVNEKGEVTEARAESGAELLRAAAIAAAKQFQFANPLQQTVRATLTFNFVLGDKNSAPPKKPSA